MRLANIITQELRQVIGPGNVQLHEPSFKGNEWRYVKDCIDSGWVSSVGDYVNRFEEDLTKLTGAKHAVVVSNGTSALHMALVVAGIEPGDEVIVPALSFVATANAVRHSGAFPHFADSEMKTLGLSAVALEKHLERIGKRSGEYLLNKETGRRISCIVPMHTFGHPVDMPALLNLARHYGLKVVEDAAESLGSLIGDRHTGTFGICGVLSFNGNKIVTTGGGGAIITNDPDLAKRAKHLTTTAKLPHKWRFTHDAVAYNYRMPNINAALGCAQLEQLEGFVTAKRELAERYFSVFSKVNGVTFFREPEGTRSNYWLQTLILDPMLADQRDEILAVTNAAGLMTRPAWDLLSTLPMYRDSPAMNLPCATDLANRIVNLPSSPQLLGKLVGN